MARKIVNRKALREEVEAAEKSAAEKTAAEKPAEAQKPPRAPAKRKSRSKEAEEKRIKIVWRVYSQAMKLMATFEYHQKKEADKKAEALSQSTKTPHFVKKDKIAIET